MLPHFTQETKSKDVVVGDIIRLEDNDQVPVDVLLLASSDDYLRCLINTANLDGETNLKVEELAYRLMKLWTWSV